MPAFMGNPAAMKKGGIGNGFAPSPRGMPRGTAQRSRFAPFRPPGAGSFVGGPKNMGQAPGKK